MADVIGSSAAVTGWLRAYGPRVVCGLALATVAAVTGRISYIHIHALSLALHQPPEVARLMPFGVDGLIVVGSVVLLTSGGWLGWLGIGPGSAISLFANVESGIAWGLLAAAWAGIPAVAFTLSTFMFERWLVAQAQPSASATPAADVMVAGSSPRPQPDPAPAVAALASPPQPRQAASPAASARRERARPASGQPAARAARPASQPKPGDPPAGLVARAAAAGVSPRRLAAMHDITRHRAVQLMQPGSYALAGSVNGYDNQED